MRHQAGVFSDAQHRTTRMGRRGVAAAVIALSLLSATISAAAITFDGARDVAYEEQAPPVRIADGLTVVDGSPYDGGYLEFSIHDAAVSEVLDLIRSTNADATDGAVSVVGSEVFLGNGATADRIGVVHSGRDGDDGRPLRIDFDGRTILGDFEDGTLQGWTPIEEQVDLGATTIAGHRTIDTATYPAASAGNDETELAEPGEFSVAASSPLLGNRLTMTSGGHTVAERCTVVHGPAAFSPSFEASAGDTLSFVWHGVAKGDAFTAFGYLLDEAGGQTEVIDVVYDAEYGQSAVTRTSVAIPADGTFHFVIVGGNYDSSCGRRVKSHVTVDDVVKIENLVDDDAIRRIVRLVTYENGSDDPPPVRDVSVTIVNAFDERADTDFDILIAATDDAITIDPIPPISYENTVADDTFADATGSLRATDPEGGRITYSMTGAEHGAFSAGGRSYDQRVVLPHTTVFLDTRTGEYRVVPDDPAIEATTENTTDGPVEMIATAGASSASTLLVIDIEVSTGGTVTSICLSDTWTEDASDVYDDVLAFRTYHDPASWAHENRIVFGRSPRQLEPDEHITRAEFITMVHRMLCLPAPQAVAPFGDITTDGFYRTALDWSVGETVIRGTSPTTFSPNDLLTRAHVAAIMHRLAGRPAVVAEGPAPFSDLRSNSYYEAGATWMGLTGLTIADENFGPDDPTTRGEALIVLWRYSTILD